MADEGQVGKAVVLSTMDAVSLCFVEGQQHIVQGELCNSLGWIVQILYFIFLFHSLWKMERGTRMSCIPFPPKNMFKPQP